MLLVGLAVALGIGVAVGIGVWASTAARPVPPERREAVAGELLAGVHVSATVVGSSLAVTSAEADFGIEEGIRPVRVRIVAELQLEVRIEADRNVTLEAPPSGCLAGSDWAPDDAGLESRCWGEPDIGQLVGAALPTDGAGHPFLAGHRPIIVQATLERGDARCDYPPGAWDLEIAGDPLIDGTPVTGLDPIAIPFVVDFADTGVLPLLGPYETRFCSSARPIWDQQGEPPVASPQA